MKTLYLDIFSGVSGDMFIAALLDLGVEFAQLEKKLQQLGLTEFHLHVSRQERAHIAGTRFEVHDESAPPGQGEHQHAHEHEHEHAHQHHHHHHEHEEHHEHHEHPEHGHQHGAGHRGEPEQAEHQHGRSFAQIRGLIEKSQLSGWVKQKATGVFQRLAVAEGKIHGHPPAEVHFHEVGAIDSIVDVVGACAALELLGRPRVLAGPVIEGTGWIDCAHGRFPIPAPATLEILAARGIGITQCAEPHELVTPTGAALLAEFAESFGPLRGLKVEKIGYGLGTREHQTRPNVLRAILGEFLGETATHDWETDTIAVLQTNLDDTTAELLGSFVEKALAQGALDVFHTPIQMKKNRPGVLLTLLCAEADAERFSELVLRETTAFGLRRQTAERRKLIRELSTVQTRYGPVTLKLGKLDGQIVQAAPEYESCRRLAETAKVPLKQIYEAAVRGLPSQ